MSDTPNPSKFSAGKLGDPISQDVMLRMLNALGRIETCEGCPETIWWVKTKAGAAAPYTARGINHFIDCPERERFRQVNKPKF